MHAAAWLMNYRTEIDGLRSIAIVSVVLFHAGVETFKGGFVGVDVFFVISGYLITKLLQEEIATGQFSFRLFLERRARRLLPALFVVLAACIPAAWLYMWPEDSRVFFTGLIYTTLFASNIFFW